MRTCEPLVEFDRTRNRTARRNLAKLKKTVENRTVLAHVEPLHLFVVLAHVVRSDRSERKQDFIIHHIADSRIKIKIFVIPTSIRQYISVPKCQNTVRLIFGKNELGAVSESLRPPLSIAGPIMTLAGL